MIGKEALTTLHAEGVKNSGYSNSADEAGPVPEELAEMVGLDPWPR